MSRARAIAEMTPLALGRSSPESGRLPDLAMETDWKGQQRLWGHSFHPMCSYLGSFPAALAHASIARYSR
ncbi:MAG: hypothetical protein M3395_06550, partial [Chloroflexota bacterium]|nr:hypothetical protein [Chloroflexota bacterium]